MLVLRFPMLYRVLPSFTGIVMAFHFILLRDLSGLYKVKLDFTVFLFNWIRLGLTWFNWVLPDFTVILGVLLGFTWFCKVLPGFTSIC